MRADSTSTFTLVLILGRSGICAACTSMRASRSSHAGAALGFLLLRIASLELSEPLRMQTKVIAGERSTFTFELSTGALAFQSPARPSASLDAVGARACAYPYSERGSRCASSKRSLAPRLRLMALARRHCSKLGDTRPIVPRAERPARARRHHQWSARASRRVRTRHGTARHLATFRYTIVKSSASIICHCECEK